MCINPRQLEKRQSDGSFKIYTVPCGKCPECRAKYQSEYAALSVLEANMNGSLAFITLTYDNNSLPVWIIRDTAGVKSPVAFSRGCECSLFQRDDWSRNGCRLVPDCTINFDDFLCPSLNRDDVKAFLKNYRQDYFRRHGERLDFRFSCFGEYGEKLHRPHYHMLVYGLSRDEVNRLCKKWSHGFSYVEFVDRFNPDGSDAFVKVSRYVSKYVSKCDLLPDFVQLGYAEKPRKQSSVRLGRRNLNYEHLRNFI